MLASVVQKLNLADDPEFGSPPVQMRHVVKAILASVVQKLNLADDPEFGSPPVGLIRRVFQVFTNPTSAEPKLDATETAIATLADRLTVNRVGWSFVIEIGASSRSPEKSAQIANAVADGLHRRSAGRKARGQSDHFHVAAGASAAVG